MQNVHPQIIQLLMRLQTWKNFGKYFSSLALAQLLITDKEKEKEIENFIFLCI